MKCKRCDGFIYQEHDQLAGSTVRCLMCGWLAWEGTPLPWQREREKARLMPQGKMRPSDELSMERLEELAENLGIKW